MKRIFALTILMVSIAAFAMEGRTVYLALITAGLSLILVSVVDIGKRLTTRTSLTTREAEMGMERVRRG